MDVFSLINWLFQNGHLTLCSRNGRHAEDSDGAQKVDDPTGDVFAAVSELN